MGKSGSDDSGDDSQVDAIETTNISPNVENYSKRTFKWVSLLYAEIGAILVNPGKYAQRLKELEDVLALLDDEGLVIKCLTIIKEKLKEADVENKLDTTPPNPSKKRKTADVTLPINKSKNLLDIMENIITFARLFKIEAIRLSEKQTYGKDDVTKIYQLKSDAKLSKTTLLEAREDLKGIINTMKAKEIPSVAGT